MPASVLENGKGLLIHEFTVSVLVDFSVLLKLTLWAVPAALKSQKITVGY